MKLKVGVIGLGRLGRVYARDLSSRLAETELIAVADTNADLARSIAAEFDVARSYGQPEELLGDRNVEAVVIVSPTHTHKDVVIAAMKARKPTFCEKPLALSLDECRAMDTAVTVKLVPSLFAVPVRVNSPVVPASSSAVNCTSVELVIPRPSTVIVCASARVRNSWR